MNGGCKIEAESADIEGPKACFILFPQEAEKQTNLWTKSKNTLIYLT